jgi:hypothetical protein
LYHTCIKNSTFEETTVEYLRQLFGPVKGVFPGIFASLGPRKAWVTA